MQFNANLMCNTQSESTPITLFPDTSANQYVTPDNRDVHNKDCLYIMFEFSTTSLPQAFLIAYQSTSADV
jgi:hypothetical protein